MTATVVSATTPRADVTAVARQGDVERGQQYFLPRTCGDCHGFNGERAAPRSAADYVAAGLTCASDVDLLAFIREGARPDHTDNVTGIAMPPSGGQPAWTDEQMLDLIAYIRWLHDQK
ncbi:MAG: cytochrome c [Chloroflexi bacterium]|uniref:c-type cytochrome n=1 Tax=Candidatus Flexifilum breve TaxID=3140694 RepID=UPI003136C0AB|nr:cytochrome c [Chloroflexota bacterium]